jgi:hypothetical protein
MLADQRRAPPDLTSPFGELGEASWIIHRRLQFGMLNPLPEAASLVLRIFEDFFNAGDGITEHLPFDDFFEELCFRHAFEKLPDGLFHAIDFLLSDPGNIKGLPVLLFEKLRRHALAIHPLD